MRAPVCVCARAFGNGRGALWQEPTPGPLTCALRKPVEDSLRGSVDTQGRTRRPQGARGPGRPPTHTPRGPPSVARAIFGGSAVLEGRHEVLFSCDRAQGRQSPACPTMGRLLLSSLGATGPEGVSRGPLVASNSAKGEPSRRLTRGAG